MKILLLNDDYPPYRHNSVAEITRMLAIEYRKHGHEVSILTTHRTEDDSSIRRTENIISIPVSYRKSLRQWFSLYNPSINKSIKKIFSEVKPNVVHAHNIHMYLTYDSLRIARKFTPNIFITMHDVMSFSSARLAHAKFLNTKGEATKVNPIDHFRAVGLEYNPIRNWYIRGALKKNARKVIAVSHSLEKALSANGITHLHTIHHGIDLNAWKTTEEEREAFCNKYKLHGKKIIFFGGRLSIDKGVMPLLETLRIVCKSVPNILLFIAGEEKRWKEFLQESEDLQDAILVSGWLSPDEMRIANSIADVATTPSLCLDTFNMMNLEAMAASKPVVGTCFGGTPEIIEDGKTGFIIDPRDTEQYAQTLIKLLKDPELAKQMGKAGRKRVEQNFTLEKNVQEYLKLFEATE